MPSLFARAARAASRTNDRVYGEGFTLERRAAPSSGGLPDVNARRAPAPVAPLPFVGVYVEEGRLMNAHGRAMSDASSHAIASGSPMIDAPAHAFPEPPQVGWHVVRDDTGERFRISHVLPIDFRRLQLHVTAAR